MADIIYRFTAFIRISSQTYISQCDFTDIIWGVYFCHNSECFKKQKSP